MIYQMHSNAGNLRFPCTNPPLVVHLIVLIQWRFTLPNVTAYNLHKIEKLFIILFMNNKIIKKCQSLHVSNNLQEVSENL